MSGVEHLVSLDELVRESEVILMGSPVGPAQAKTTKDGIYKYSIQKFEIKRVLYPKELSLKSAAVSNFDGYLYGIIKHSAEGKGNRIGIFRRYQSVTKDSTPQILFLKKASEIGGGDYDYILPGAYESLKAEDSVRAALKREKASE